MTGSPRVDVEGSASSSSSIAAIDVSLDVSLEDADSIVLQGGDGNKCIAEECRSLNEEIKSDIEFVERAKRKMELEMHKDMLELTRQGSRSEVLSPLRTFKPLSKAQRGEALKDVKDRVRKLRQKESPCKKKKIEPVRRASATNGNPAKHSLAKHKHSEKKPHVRPLGPKNVF